MSNNKMSDLLKKQEAERQDLAVGAYSAWLYVQEKEAQLLASFDGVCEKAPQHIQDDINKTRKEYLEEWGSDGKLAVLMTARHNKEREKLIQRQNKIEQLQNMQKRSKDKDRGR